MMFEWRTPEDEQNFKIGMTLVWRPTWRERWLDRLAWLDWWHRVTRWWRPRYYTSAVDVERGQITISVMRWSWRRWRWEPQP